MFDEIRNSEKGAEIEDDVSVQIKKTPAIRDLTDTASFKGTLPVNSEAS